MTHEAQDDRALTRVTKEGTPVHLADRPCSACGCYQAFRFECNCGAVHSDVCYNCDAFVDMAHTPIEEADEDPRSMLWAGRCTAGRVEHTHAWPLREAHRDDAQDEEEIS